MEAKHLSLLLLLCLGVHRSSSEILKRQKRNWIIDSFKIYEDYNGGYPYPLGKIDVEKNFTFFRIEGQGADQEPKGILKINENTGEVTVHAPVDYEQYQVLKLSFQALDREKHVVDTQLGIEILIYDANDNAPTFDFESYDTSIREATLQGTDVITVRATDIDSTEIYRLFDFTMMSVLPKPLGLEFYLTQAGQTATISFKGCLDHEMADKYTIIVEAKDRGDKVQQSSSSTVIVHIEDGNNHLPKITGQTGPGRVKEGEENVLVKRLQVEDKDTKGTPAWKAKYYIQGDKNENFRIETDSLTNEGLLYVEKPLDYEDNQMMNLTISVENEIPYHSCEVKSQSSTGLWNVDTKTLTDPESRSTSKVRVTVEDVNEPPFFIKANKHITVVENVKAGHYLETFTAKDPDITNTFVYKKGDDPADWVTVDAKTGKITTTKVVDRESSFVKNNIYETTILAVDNGQPPMTGTATLHVHITDENDHDPILPNSVVDMCDSDGVSLASITAVDLDEEPYGGPFTFNLLGDVKGKWRLDPKQGFSVNLVKEPAVHSGHYNLLLEVFDLQGKGVAQNLSVTVCNCENPAEPNCNVRRAAGSALGGGALAILFIGMLLLAVVLLLAFLVSCKKEHAAIPDDGSGQHLMASNIEKPGTDCSQVAFEAIKKGPNYEEQIVPLGSGIKQTETHKQDYHNQTVTDSSMNQNFTYGNATRWSMGASSATRTRNQLGSSMRGTWAGHQKYSDQESVSFQRSAVLKVLTKSLYSQEAPGEELGDYPPHVYAEEGDGKTNFDLDAISISDVSFDPDMDLDNRFNSLATVCMPSNIHSFHKS